MPSFNAQVVYYQHGVGVKTLKYCLRVLFLRLLRGRVIDTKVLFGGVVSEVIEEGGC